MNSYYAEYFLLNETNEFNEYYFRDGLKHFKIKVYNKEIIKEFEKQINEPSYTTIKNLLKEEFSNVVQTSGLEVYTESLKKRKFIQPAIGVYCLNQSRG